MKTYQNELDEVLDLKSKEMDSLIKMTANNNYIKIKEIEANVDKTKNELVNSQNALNIQLSEVLSDIGTVKMHRKNLKL